MQLVVLLRLAEDKRPRQYTIWIGSKAVAKATDADLDAKYDQAREKATLAAQSGGTQTLSATYREGGLPRRIRGEFVFSPAAEKSKIWRGEGVARPRAR